MSELNQDNKSTFKFPGYETFDKILLIEDNLGDARLVKIFLAESDLYEYEVVNKQTLEEGLEELRSRNNFAVVLLDLTLPDSRGFETLERLFAVHPETNVIVLTGLSDKKLGLRAVKAGAQDFLIKGQFDADNLSKTLKYSIERNRIINRLEEAQRIAHIGNWELYPDTEQITASDEVYRIFGYLPSNDDVSLDDFRKALHPEDFERLNIKLEENQDQNYFQSDFRIFHKDGTLRYINVQWTQMRNSEGHLVKMSGIVQDITELRRNAEELVKSKQRYQTIFNQSKDAIYISTKEGRLIDFNQAAEELFGYNREELGKLDIRALYSDPKGRDRMSMEVEKDSFVQDFEVAIRRKNGEIRHCIITASKILTKEFDGFHGIVRDITERKQADELRKAKELAEREAKMKEQFLANVSHEIRTPMNAILGMTHLLLKTELDETQYNFSNSIRQASENLLSIINDILEISQIQSGKISIEQKEFDLHDLLYSQLMNVIKYKADEKNIALELIVADNIEPKLLGDPTRLGQILLNLATNAIKFTDDGGQIVIRVIRSWIDKDKVELKFEVQDNGEGIEPEKIDTVFEMFVQVSDDLTKSHGGTGLGLAIVKQLVEMQGGKVGLNSEKNVGSTFHFYLPFRRVNDETDKQEVIDEQVVVRPNKEEIKILLVEDHKMNQIVAKKIIESEWADVKVVIAENGREGIEKLLLDDYDIILMDIQMPEMDGYEATHYIRNNMPPKKAKIPILAMTAHAFVSQNEKYKEYGMDDFVLKPFDPKQLFLKLAEYIKTTEVAPNTNNNTMNISYEYIDLSYMDMMADGDNEIKRTMLELLLNEPSEELKKMRLAAEQQDWNELKSVSHKMKSTLAFVGNQLMTDTNKKIEDSAMNQTNLTELPQLVDALEELFQKALVELKTEYSKL